MEYNFLSMKNIKILKKNMKRNVNKLFIKI